MNTPFDPVWTIGFMSGTSLDAVDAAMILTDGERVLEYGPVAERKYTPEERAVLQSAVTAARDWNWRGPQPDWSAANGVLSRTHRDAFDAVLSQTDDRPGLVGVHGQTVLHKRPKDGEMGQTLQILDANAIAQDIGLPVWYDFRTNDVLNGGEGAPLAPVYHRALLADRSEGPHVVLNLGGVANITWVGTDGDMLAFDTGPANGPIDEWVEAHQRGTYDKDGAFAMAGHVHEGHLIQLLDHPYFGEAPPKSLDRYDFDAGLVRGLSFEDGAATLTALSARGVGLGISLCPSPPNSVIACGGGRHNPAMMQALQDAVPCAVISAESAGCRGDSIEAEAFALLAVRAARSLPISFPTTTGVAEPLTGGRVAQP